MITNLLCLNSVKTRDLKSVQSRCVAALKFLARVLGFGLLAVVASWKRGQQVPEELDGFAAQLDDAMRQGLCSLE